MSDLVNAYEMRCAVCDKLISKRRLDIESLSEKGGVVAQVLKPMTFQGQALGGMMSVKNFTSLESDVACSKECAEKLMRRLARKRVGEENVFVSMSGAEIRKLDENFEPKKYVLEAWNSVQERSKQLHGRHDGTQYVPTTFQLNPAISKQMDESMARQRRYEMLDEPLESREALLGGDYDDEGADEPIMIQDGSMSVQITPAPKKPKRDKK